MKTMDPNHGTRVAAAREAARLASVLLDGESSAGLIVRAAEDLENAWSRYRAEALAESAKLDA